jgi:hypothetical protein
MEHLVRSKLLIKTLLPAYLGKYAALNLLFFSCDGKEGLLEPVL